MEILDYPFMQTALVMGVVLGALFSMMGVFVVTRGMAFFGDFLAHSALLGGALALIIGVEPSIFLIIYCLAMGFAVSAIWQRMPLSRDTVLGVFYGGTVSIAILLMTGRGLGKQSLLQFLLGDILLIGPHDVWLASGLLIVFTVFSAMNRRRLVKATFLPEMAEAEGIRVRGYEMALIALMSLTIALSIKVVGVLLANAMVVIPAAAAKSVSRNLRAFIIAAPLFGVLSFIAGLSLSFHLNLPSGPSIVATAFALFIVTFPFRAK
jgi:zinc/manganese transport system permease protein